MNCLTHILVWSREQKIEDLTVRGLRNRLYHFLTFIFVVSQRKYFIYSSFISQPFKAFFQVIYNFQGNIFQILVSDFLKNRPSPFLVL